MLGPAPDGRHERLIELNVEDTATPGGASTLGPGIGSGRAVAVVTASTCAVPCDVALSSGADRVAFAPVNQAARASSPPHAASAIEASTALRGTGTQ